MKKLYHVWTKEPYGSWEKVSAKPASEVVAEGIADLLRGSGRQLKVEVLESGKKPLEGAG